MEAMVAGLGLVLSEYATANLDASQPFISVIPEDEIGDVNYVQKVIEDNRKVSLSMRNEIRSYAKQFEWKNIIKQYYIPSIENVIDKWLVKYDWI
jgi:hypothetical protein